MDLNGNELVEEEEEENDKVGEEEALCLIIEHLKETLSRPVNSITSHQRCLLAILGVALVVIVDMKMRLN